MINNRPLINYAIKEGEFKSWAHMAKELDMSPHMISHYYSNKYQISGNFILAIMRYLGTPIATIDELLAAQDDGTNAWRDEHALFDKLMLDNGIYSDIELAKRLNVIPSIVSQHRQNKIIDKSSIVLKVHEVFGMPISEIRKLLGE